MRITVRDAMPEDFGAIEQIHAKMGMDYALPALGQPLVFVRKVTTDDSGKVIAACFLRLCAECYLVLEPDLAPRKIPRPDSGIATRLTLSPSRFKS